MTAPTLYKWALAVAKAYRFQVEHEGDELALYSPPVRAPEAWTSDARGDAEDILDWFRRNGDDVDAYRPQDDDADCDGVDYDDCDGPSAA